MKVILLAGGLGTRLQSLVPDTPKPMADVNGVPFLQLLLDNMIFFGATEFILCVSYLKEKIIGHFGNSYRNCAIRYSVENEPLGTGGAILQAFRQFDVDNALVLNGDNFTEADYAKFYQDSRQGDFAIVLRQMPDASAYGRVEVDGRHVLSFREKEPVARPGFINTGSYFISRNFWRLAPPAGKFSLERDVFEKSIRQLQAPYTVCDGFFIDIGTPAGYALACRELHLHIRT